MSHVIDTMGLRVRDDWRDREPRIRDIELGQRLGYARPRKLRELVAKMVASGSLLDVELRPVAGRDDGAEYWLTEKQTLKVIARSETDAADRILDEVIDVFIAYRRGKLMPRLLADAPCEWDPMWSEKVVGALCRLYGQPHTKRFPPFLASVLAKLYKLVLEPETYVELKRRNPDPRYGSNHHQHLTEQARARFRSELHQIELAALMADSPDEFWSKLERIYLGHPMQLRFMGLGINGDPSLPANSNDSRARAGAGAGR